MRETLKDTPQLGHLRVKLSAFKGGKMAFNSKQEIVNYSNRLTLQVGIAYTDGVINRLEKDGMQITIDEAAVSNISNFQEF